LIVGLIGGVVWSKRDVLLSPQKGPEVFHGNLTPGVSAPTEEKPPIAVVVATVAPAKVEIEPEALPPPAPIPERYVPPPLPELEVALRDAPISAMVGGEKPRVTIKGRQYGIGQEIVPKLVLKRVEGRTIIAEDADGAVYRRTF
jgi:hypothetical protein